MDRAVLGSGLTGLITGYILGWPVIGDKIGGQAGSDFPLGPRILEEDEYSILLLESLGIDKEPKTFKVGYFYQDRLYPGPPPGFREEYYKKTRGEGEFTSSSMSGGRNRIVGWDWGEIGLLKALAQRVAIHQRVITDISKTLARSETYLTLCRRTSEGLAYDRRVWARVVNTMPLPIFLKLSRLSLGREPRAFDTTFGMTSPVCSSKISWSSWLGDYAYVYFSGETHPFHRVTRYESPFEEDRFIVEVGSERYEDLKNHPEFKVQEEGGLLKPPKFSFSRSLTIHNCQILNNLGLEEMQGIPFVGRYAQWDHSIKLNQVIKEAMVLAKQMGRVFK